MALKCYLLNVPKILEKEGLPLGFNLLGENSRSEEVKMSET